LSLSSPVTPSPSSSTSLPIAWSPLTSLSSSPVAIGRDTSHHRHRPRRCPSPQSSSLPSSSTLSPVASLPSSLSLSSSVVVVVSRCRRHLSP
jgi:hypothetical protein